MITAGSTRIAATTSSASSSFTRRIFSAAGVRSSKPPRIGSPIERLQSATPNAADIRWVQLVKPMAVTHSCDTGQRLIDLPIVRGSRNFCRLDVRVPREPGIAPPGLYMLLLTDDDGVPSHAHWIQVTS